MSDWSILPSWFRAVAENGEKTRERRTPTRPTVRLWLEELEQRNAPGSLLGLSGLTRFGAVVGPDRLVWLN